MATIGYVDESDFTAWLSARGITLTGTAAVQLTNAFDWVELQSYKGTRTEEDQENSWPRTGVYIDGILQASDEVPQLVKELQMRVAVDIDAGNDALGVSSQTVKRELVEGAIEVEYMDGSYSGAMSKQVSMLLSKLTSSAGGTQFSVSRA